MRNLFLILLVWLGTVTLFGQSIPDSLEQEGTVTYISSQNIYIRFESTKDIQPGDTLFIKKEEKLLPALLVKHLSSSSVVATPLTDEIPPKETKIYAVNRRSAVTEQPSETPIVIAIQQAEEKIIPDEEPLFETSEEEQKPLTVSSKVKGRISATSYINISDYPGADKQRMRYTMTFNAPYINHSRFSAESYISFKHTINEWEEVQQQFHQAFKVYNLAVQYDVPETMRFWLGRKINPNISNIGAIDGLQGERYWNKFLAGGFTGFRPDAINYGLNTDLFQFGAYGGYWLQGKNGTIQNTIAFVEQRYQQMTDRRFLYLQHINSSIRDVYVFTSFEFDLYKNVNDHPQSVFDITSLYVSVRYRPIDKLTLFASYDARNNIIYYETYKNFIDKLLEEETRQGFRFNMNYRPAKYITLGASAGYRFQKDQPDASKNLHSYLTISRIPGLRISATLSAVLLHSAYLDGNIYGIRASRDFMKGRLNAEAEYRVVKYHYVNTELPLNHTIIGANFSYRITRKLSYSINLEEELQEQHNVTRIYMGLIQRF